MRGRYDLVSNPRSVTCAQLKNAWTRFSNRHASLRSICTSSISDDSPRNSWCWKMSSLGSASFCPPRDEPPPKDFEPLSRPNCVITTPSNLGNYSHSNLKQSLYHENIHKHLFYERPFSNLIISQNAHFSMDDNTQGYKRYNFKYISPKK